MKKYLLAALGMVFAFWAYAQDVREWEPLLSQMGNIEDTESLAWESSYDLLCELEDNPLNINTATRDELEQLPFLSAKEVENISEYIYRYGPIKTLGELAAVKDLGYYQRRLLFYFVYAGEIEKPLFPTLKNILKYGKHEFLATGKVPLYDRAGDKKGYEGYKYKHSIRYDFTYGSRLGLGFLGAQDAGEPFFAGVNNLGYDFYSFYLVLKNLGRVKTLALGRYRLRFGHGLVINNNFGFGKISSLSSMGRGASNIRAHSSRSEGNYLQGAAATVGISKGLDVSTFVSYRSFDATLNKDDGTISTILNAGYHRTRTEIDKKNNSSHFLVGGNIDYRSGGFNAGLTAIYYSLDKELRPNTDAVYRRHYASGKTFYNLGLNYGYTGSRFSFSGEVATGGCKAVATQNTISYGLSEKVDLMALYRFYSYKYYSLFSESFSDGGSVQNESGMYLGIRWRPLPTLDVMAYTDFAYFAWPKYQASQSSRSFDNLLQATYVHGDWAFSMRYRIRCRERDNSEKTALAYKMEQRGRLGASYACGVWRLKTQFDVASVDHKKNSFGWMITQNLGCKLWRIVDVHGGIGYFDTDDYDSRLYTYERGMLHSFSFPSFYGNGIRCFLIVGTDRIKNLLLLTKVGTNKYFDRSAIGSGYQRIDGSSMTDLELQARWKF